jgi:hypothetical protein
MQEQIKTHIHECNVNATGGNLAGVNIEVLPIDGENTTSSMKFNIDQNSFANKSTEEIAILMQEQIQKQIQEAGMDLSGVNIRVLSSEDTGTGDVHTETTRYEYKMGEPGPLAVSLGADAKKIQATAKPGLGKGKPKGDLGKADDQKAQKSVGKVKMPSQQEKEAKEARSVGKLEMPTPVELTAEEKEARNVGKLQMPTPVELTAEEKEARNVGKLKMPPKEELERPVPEKRSVGKLGGKFSMFGGGGESKPIGPPKPGLGKGSRSKPGTFKFK